VVSYVTYILIVIGILAPVPRNMAVENDLFFPIPPVPLY
jgi:hypothetical protein